MTAKSPTTSLTTLATRKNPITIPTEPVRKKRTPMEEELADIRNEEEFGERVRESTRTSFPMRTRNTSRTRVIIEEGEDVDTDEPLEDEMEHEEEMPEEETDVAIRQRTSRTTYR